MLKIEDEYKYIRQILTKKDDTDILKWLKLD